MSIMRYLYHPITFAVFAGAITLALMKLDCMACKHEKSTSVYCKNIATVSSLVAAAVYTVQRFGGGSHGFFGGGLRVEEIKLGEPNF